MEFILDMQCAKCYWVLVLIGLLCRWNNFELLPHAWNNRLLAALFSKENENPSIANSTWCNLLESYLWLIRVRSLELFRFGNCNLSRNRGFASISFLSSTSIMVRADFVSPYFESCSFSLKSYCIRHHRSKRWGKQSR